MYKENYSENDDYKTLSGLNGHPAFPAFHYIDQRKRWMVVEKVDGFTLAEAVRSGEKLDSRTYAQIEEIVEDCYDEGIIPSDLHLNNLMLDKDTNRIRVIDTGRFFLQRTKRLTGPASGRNWNVCNITADCSAASFLIPAQAPPPA